MHMISNYRTLVTGLLFTVPFWLAFMFGSSINDALWAYVNQHERNWEVLTGSYTLVVNILGLVGAIVIASPLFKKGGGGKLEFYLVNAVLAAIMLLVFSFLAIFSVSLIAG